MSLILIVKQQKPLWWILVALALCMLLMAGCGFRTLAIERLATVLPVVRLESGDNYDELTLKMAKLLKQHKIRVLMADELPAEQAAKLQIENQFDYQVKGAMYSTAARVYGMRYHVNFKLTTAQGQLIASQNHLTLERDILLQPNEIFEVTGQVNAAKREMCEQLARDILRVIILQYENQTEPARHSVKSVLSLQGSAPSSDGTCPCCR